MSVTAIDATPTEMVGEPGSFGAFHQIFQPPQMFAIGLFRRAEVHRDAVLHHFVLIKNLIQDAQRSSAINHEIFGDDFKPIHHGLTGEDVMVMRGAQTNPNSVIRVAVKPVRWHCQLRWILRRRGVEGQSLASGPQHQVARSCCESPIRRRLVWLRAVGRAAALALARVLAFAAVVARFTSTFALAGVLTLASVFFLHLVLRLVLRCE